MRTSRLVPRAWIVLLGAACALLPLLLVGLAVGLGGAPSVPGWSAGGTGGGASPNAHRGGIDRVGLLLALSPAVCSTAPRRRVEDTDGSVSARASTSSVRLPLRI